MMFDDTNIIAPAPTCPACKVSFTPKRRDQRYCGRACQRHATRGLRGAAESIEAQARNRAHYTRAAWLCLDLYKIAPALRLGFMSDLIKAAREHDGQLRNILTDPKLIGAPMNSGVGKLYPDNRNPVVKNIAKAADAYCRAFWGFGVRDVVHCRCPVPPTGEGDDIEGHAPSTRPRTYRGEPRGCLYRSSSYGQQGEALVQLPLLLALVPRMTDRSACRLHLSSAVACRPKSNHHHFVSKAKPSKGLPLRFTSRA